MDECRRLLGEALERYLTFAKFWMVAGQVEEDAGRVHEAREAYAKGAKQCPKVGKGGQVR